MGKLMEGAGLTLAYLRGVGFSQSLSEKVLPIEVLSSLKLFHFACNQ